MKNLSLILFVIAAGLFSCQNEADPVADKSFFTKFYDDSNFSAVYIPLDAVQTSDGGYLVLGIRKVIEATGDEVTPGAVYVMKTDEFGALVSEPEVDASLGLPAPSLLNVGGKFYFFCTDLGSYGAQLVELDESGAVVSQSSVNRSYPLAAAVDGNSLLLLSFDNGAKETVMTVVGTDGSTGASEGFTIGAGDGYAPQGLILEHALRTGPQRSFFVGKTASGLYYFNGFYNYALSTVFTTLGGDGPSGVVQGYFEKGSVSALQPLNGGKFAAARFNFGDNYVMPDIDLVTAGAPSEWADLGGYAFPELTANAPVKIVMAKINGVDRIIYGSNTRGKQIGLFGYNPTDGSLIGTRYIGFSNSFEIASLVPTSDDGLLIVGTTYIAGRFPRICLFKLSAEALGQSFK